MRWKLPEKGSDRIRKGFLFKPRCMNGEYRWLEFATWIQYYDNYGTFGYWRDEEWC